jgi:hypothetical protein
MAAASGKSPRCVCYLIPPCWRAASWHALSADRTSREFVIEFRSRRRIAVRQVEATDDEVTDFGFDVSAMQFIGFAGQATPPLHRNGTTRQNGDGASGSLSMPDRAVARFLEGQHGEFLIRRFQLLEADDVGRGLGEPAKQDRRRPLMPFMVKGRDFHLGDSAEIDASLRFSLRRVARQSEFDCRLLAYDQGLGIITNPLACGVH